MQCCSRIQVQIVISNHIEQMGCLDISNRSFATKTNQIHHEGKCFTTNQNTNLVRLLLYMNINMLYG